MHAREQKRPPVHPGRALRRVLEEAGLTPSAASAALGVPVSRLTLLRNLCADVAEHADAV
jgi:plasmid maintenance system antidote protein VapI